MSNRMRPSLPLAIVAVCLVAYSANGDCNQKCREREYFQVTDANGAPDQCVHFDLPDCGGCSIWGKCVEDGVPTGDASTCGTINSTPQRVYFRPAVLNGQIICPASCTARGTYSEADSFSDINPPQGTEVHVCKPYDPPGE